MSVDGRGAAPGDPLARGTPPGSLRHFAVLYGASPARGLIQAIYAFEAEIEETVRAASHEVSHTRLLWWRGEIDRLLAGAPQHPVTRALDPLRDRPGVDLAFLHEALVAADIDLARLTFANDAELEAYCFRATGSLQSLIAEAAAGEQLLALSARDFARRLGSAIKQVELLRDFRVDLAHGRLRVPLDRFDRAGVDPHQLQPDSVDRGLLDILEAWQRAVAQELDALPARLESRDRATQRHGLVLAALYRRLLERIDHRREIARTRAEVPHWTRLWTAWRTAVRYG